MCGRFVGYSDLARIERYFPIDLSEIDLSPNYNAAPTQFIPAIVRRNRKNVLDLFHWGLIPFWAKDQKIGYKLINARCETVAEKPSFRQAFKKRRCLILADGFFEWKKIKGKKQPVLITLDEQKPFAFAGLWESWQPKDSHIAPIRSCTIITTRACSSLSDIHHRMPVILAPDAYEQWLDPDVQDTELLKKLLLEKSIRTLSAMPVSNQVNSVKNNLSSNIKPLNIEL